MNNKMKLCKTCKQEIAKNANVCPHCGSKNKTSYPIIFILLICIILIAVIACTSNDDEPKRIDDDSSSLTQPERDSNEFSVGEKVELNDVIVTLLGVSESSGSDYNVPTEGNIFILCEFEISNNSEKDINISSMMSFEAYCDDYACSFSLSALMEKGNKNQLDGTVAPGKRFVGVVGYEIPQTWKELEIHFTPDLWNGKDIVFIATND